MAMLRYRWKVLIILTCSWNVPSVPEPTVA